MCVVGRILVRSYGTIRIIPYLRVVLISSREIVSQNVKMLLVRELNAGSNTVDYGTLIVRDPK